MCRHIEYRSNTNPIEDETSIGFQFIKTIIVVEVIGANVMKTVILVILWILIVVLLETFAFGGFAFFVTVLLIIGVASDSNNCK